MRTLFPHIARLSFIAMAALWIGCRQPAEAPVTPAVSAQPECEDSATPIWAETGGFGTGYVNGKYTLQGNRSIIIPLPRGLKSLNASGNLNPGTTQFHPTKLMDGSPASWCAGGEGAGVGQWFEMELGDWVKDPVRFSAFYARNGHGDAAQFHAHNRIKTLEVSSGECKTLVDLTDRTEPQIARMKKIISGRKIRFTVVALYETGYSQDACLAELALADDSLETATNPKFDEMEVRCNNAQLLLAGNGKVVGGNACAGCENPYNIIDGDWQIIPGQGLQATFKYKTDNASCDDLDIYNKKAGCGEKVEFESKLVLSRWGHRNAETPKGDKCAVTKFME